MNIIQRAELLATKAHEGQKRWGGEPYIVHPKAVAKTLEDYGCDAETIAAGWLHDVLEDTDVEKETIRKEFGERIANALVRLTHKEGDTYAEYIQKLSVNIISVRVKLADLKDNMSDLRPKEQRKQKYELAQMYLEEKVKAFENGSHPFGD